MIKRVRWVIPAFCLPFGIYLLHLSYRTHAKWQEYINLGDPSGAEIYEVQFWHGELCPS